MARIFISYASPDTVFALRLANNIQLLGHSVWIDQREIAVGDDMPRKIGEGIDQSDYIVVILSKSTVYSSWVDKELQIKYIEEITYRRTAILPIIIEDCPIPPFLRSRRFADFRLAYEIGFAQLAITLHTRSDPTGASLSYPLIDPSEETSLSICEPDFDYNSRYMFNSLPKPIEVGIELGIPNIGKISGTWKPDVEEQQAAWELYIELITRVSVAELQPDEGILREGLSSLYSIFTTTRDILRKYGPSVARTKNGSDVSFGSLAIHVLNLVLRPILSKWHPLLLDYEHTRNSSVSAFEHERRWDRAVELRKALNDVRLVLVDYTNILAQVADIPQLVQD